MTTSRDSLEQLAYNKAVEVLKRSCTKMGFLASTSGYRDVWARDGFITNLGALLTNDKELVLGARNTIRTLASAQSDTGQIPNYVKYPSAKAKFSAKDFAEAGSIDATMWYIIGVYYYFTRTGDEHFLREHWERVQKALFWLRCQDVNNCGLLEIVEAGDWTDLFSNRYNILYDEILYYASLRAYTMMARELGHDHAHYAALARDVKEKINVLFWVNRKSERTIRRLFPKWINIHRRAVLEMEYSNYYLPYVAFMSFGYRCDIYANILAILFQVSDKTRTLHILNHLTRIGADNPYPVKVLHPPVFEGEADWRDYFKYKGLNLPYQHHNGAVWPFVGGFWVATLCNLGRKKEAEIALQKLAEANKRGIRSNWEFNEWLNSQTGQPMGRPYQTWSAAMYVYGYHSTQEMKAPILGKL